MKIIALNLCVSLILIAAPSFASETYYTQHAIGWHWYHEPKDRHKTAPELAPEILDPVAKMQAIKETLDRSLKTAILFPTTENVANYIQLQNDISDKAEKFSKVWQLVLLQHPELNYQIKHPTNSLANQLHKDLTHKKQTEAIKKFAKKSGLFFFYKSSCAYCQKFAPTVKDFAEQYGIAVIPISFDGDFLPEFPDSRLDNGHAMKFNVTVTPSLFAVTPKTKKIIPIAQGFVSQEDLRQRISDIVDEGEI